MGSASVNLFCFCRPAAVELFVFVYFVLVILLGLRLRALVEDDFVSVAKVFFGVPLLLTKNQICLLAFSLFCFWYYRRDPNLQFVEQPALQPPEFVINQADQQVRGQQRDWLFLNVVVFCHSLLTLIRFDWLIDSHSRLICLRSARGHKA